jgi:hypothetical protein
MYTKPNHLLTACLLLIVMIVVACTPQATPQATPSMPLTAALKELSGTVGIKQPGSANFSPATAGTELQTNGSIQTGEDGRVRLDLSTGTIIRVAPSSLFTLTSNQPNNGSLSTQLNLSNGGIFIILNGGNASVNTPSGVASVRGSYLSVFVDPSTQTVTVTCLEGHCSAGNSAGNTDFGTGQAVTLFTCTAGQCTVPSVGPMTPEEFQFWLDNNPDIQNIPGLFATMTAAVSTQPPATSAPATEPPSTEAPTTACLTNLQGPSGNSNSDPVGPIHFSWDAKDGASQYKLSIHYPNGATNSFYIDQTNITRYLESMPSGGNYSWDITAYDSSGNPICQTGQTAFAKTSYETPIPPHKVACTIYNAQWDFPNKPCYCNYQMPNLPPYCQGG